MFDSITWIVDNKTGYKLESILTVLEAGFEGYIERGLHCQTIVGVGQKTRGYMGVGSGAVKTTTPPNP